MGPATDKCKLAASSAAASSSSESESESERKELSWMQAVQLQRSAEWSLEVGEIV